MAPPTPTFHLDVEAISGICGSISIACWVVVFSPQIIQNFQRSSADALSIQFIIVWLIGDVFNILGAVMQGVLPTMTILAVYYTIADIVLLAQCFYYRGFTWRDAPPSPPRKPTQSVGEPNERTGLLPSSANRPTDRHNSADWSALSPAVPHNPEPPATPVAPPTNLQTFAWNATVVVMVCAAGVLGWFLGQSASREDKAPNHGGEDSLRFNTLGQFFGYLCAVFYIASRLPQLILNWRRKTTDGLSMLFFLFACLGNVTYVLSIFAYDPKCRHHTCQPGEANRIYGRYILVNLSWLAGSLVTLIMDACVFGQYFIYRTEEETTKSNGVNGALADEENHHAEEEPWDHRPLLQRGDSGTA